MLLLLRLRRLQLAVLLGEGTLCRLLLLLLDHTFTEVLVIAVVPLAILAILLLIKEALCELLALPLVATLEGLGLCLLGRGLSIALRLVRLWVLARLLELLLEAVFVLLGGLPTIVLLLHLPHLLLQVATVVNLIHTTLLGCGCLGGLLHLGRLLDGLGHLMETARLVVLAILRLVMVRTLVQLACRLGHCLRWETSSDGLRPLTIRLHLGKDGLRWGTALALLR